MASSSDEDSETEDWYQKCFGHDPYKNTQTSVQNNLSQSRKDNSNSNNSIKNFPTKDKNQYRGQNKRSNFQGQHEYSQHGQQGYNQQGYSKQYNRGTSSGYQFDRPYSGSSNSYRGRNSNPYSKPDNFDPPNQREDASQKQFKEPNESQLIPIISELTFHKADDVPMTEKELQQIDVTLRPEELIRDMNMAPFYLMLEKATNVKIVSDIFKVINSCLQSSDKKALITFLSMVHYNEIFVKQNLKCFLEDYGKQNDEVEDTDDLLHILKFLKILQEYQPAAINGTLEQLGDIIEEAICDLGFSKNDITLEQELLNELRLTNNKFLTENRLADLKEMALAEKLHCYQPLKPIHKIRLFPTIEELLEDPFLRPNLEMGKYWNFDHYADVQFRLVREDMLHFLRKAVKYYKGNPEDKRAISTEEFNFYYDVKYRDIIFGPGGDMRYILFEFDNQMLKDIDWSNNKRLTYGSLLAFSHDQFTETIIYGCVARRDKDITEGLVEVEIFGLQHLLETIRSNTLEMIEVPIFLLSYKSPLDVLKFLDEDSLYLKDYIVYGQKEVKPPQYLEDIENYDLRPLFEPLPKESQSELEDEEISYNLLHGLTLPSIYYNFDSKLDKYSSINALDNKQWPTNDSIKLDSYQYDALKAGLTKELALIQGPPGTGKTYIGLRLVQTLLHNKRIYGNFPIVIACFKNHALDQFLEGILPMTSNLVRIGRQCKSDKLAPYVLPTIMDKIPNHTAELTQQLNDYKRQMKKIDKTLNKKQSAILPMSTVEEFMRDEHIKSFKEDKGEMLIPEGEELLLYWLCKNKGEFCDLNEENIDDVNQKIKQFCEEKEKNKTFKQIMAERVEVEVDIDSLNVERDYDPRRLDEIEEEYEFSSDDNTSIADEGDLKFSDMMAYHKTLGAMTFHQAAKITNVWRLSLEDRWRLYNFWLHQIEVNYTEQLRSTNIRYHEIEDEISKNLNKKKEDILKRVDVIGLTTTAAGLYSHTLMKIGPKVVIIEEAAEILEIHTLACFSSFARHLIMIGDHKQLRPHVVVQELAERFKLEISLFERLVNNGLRSYSLITQHRMKPCIAYLLTPHIYPNLENHSDVLKYERIKGVYHEMFFFNHNYKDSLKPGTVSYYNPFEAEFLIELCKYLLYQLYKPSEVTILATYNGQVSYLKELAEKENTMKGVKIATVDNYQGEENEIILLSFVRSRTKLGFLKIPNRVCVALSRARKGFYCIGNIDFFAQNSELWSAILKDLIGLGKYGKSLRLVCQNHSDIFTMINSPADFKKNAYGGCNEKCLFVYPDCKHTCPLTCHNMDREHKEFKCKQDCERIKCLEGHKCYKLCYMACGDCETSVTKQLETCRHKVKMFCGKQISAHVCKNNCNQAIKPCNHPCKGSCYQTCKPCKEEVWIRCQRNHAFKESCSTPKDIDVCNTLCTQPCKETFPCGHVCKGTCGSCYQGRFHILCDEPCNKILLCGHQCQNKCYQNCSPCPKKCSQRCCHSICPRKCGIPCSDCHEECTWTCQHFICTRTCSELCDRRECNLPCSRKFDCNHFCPGYCGEPCIIECIECHPDRYKNVTLCSEDRIVLLEDCGCVFNASCLKDWLDSDKNSEKNSDKNKILSKKCPTCDIPIQKNTRFGNIIKRTFKAINDIIKHSFGTTTKNMGFRKSLCLQIDEVIENYWYYLNWFPYFKDLFKILKKNLNEKPQLFLPELSITQNFIEISQLIFVFVDFLSRLGRKEFPEKKKALDNVALIIRKMFDCSTGLYPIQMKYVKREVKRMVVLHSLMKWKKELGDSINYGVEKNYSAVIKQIFEPFPFDTKKREKVMKDFKKAFETQNGEGSFNEGERLANPKLMRVLKSTYKYWEYCHEGHWKYKSKHHSACSHCK